LPSFITLDRKSVKKFLNSGGLNQRGIFPPGKWESNPPCPLKGSQNSRDGWGEIEDLKRLIPLRMKCFPVYTF
jgi:hypothetical protein